MMMSACLGIGTDGHGARPDLLGAGARIVDGCRAAHARRLRRVWVERIAGNNLDAMLAPIDGGVVIVVAMIAGQSSSPWRGIISAS